MNANDQKVSLYVYDLSNGMGALLGPQLGLNIQGVWHTGIVVGGKEYFFSAGVQKAMPGCTPFGKPLKVLDLGYTKLTKEDINAVMSEISSCFQPQDYNLISKNCNHFSAKVAEILGVNSVPDEIVNQAQTVFNSPVGQMLMPMFSMMESQTGNIRMN